jgi:hypothetical protein
VSIQKIEVENHRPTKKQWVEVKAVFWIAYSNKKSK